MTQAQHSPAPPVDLDELKQGYQRLRDEIGKVIVGQQEIIDMVFVSLICRGHVLLVGVPGLAKTLLIRTLADALHLSFNRIQFTPDLMPSDITGTEIIEEDAATGRRHFKFMQGPIFANVILADEINRTPPKTQAALLEAMQEHRVTAAGQTFVLEEPFFVLATQNPIEQEGTYPLPEAQLDRFMLNLWLDYPTFDQEVAVVRNTTSARHVEVEPVMTKEELLLFQSFVRQVPVADHVIEYAVSLVGKTRPGRDGTPDFVTNYLSYGAGPRASQYLILGAKALALLDGRLTPLVEDVNRMAVPVLRHRIVTNFNAEAEGISTVDLIERLLAHMKHDA
ncbi:MoxR family ATPase [Rhodocaloribacter litoris]|uniref:AAA family ATPase n=1 Tax=Rhodocaloribacter litoris TaxID=2558931 RepID=UPI0014226064|nr:MoxR family ATPase [Rhodocaloribacter litoris]QXD15306.1 MoxR family ATPase [Rhodocaloribacter litoris]